MNPIEPLASPSRSASSAYGCGGYSKNNNVIICRQRGGSISMRVPDQLLALEIRHHVRAIGELQQISSIPS